MEILPNENIDAKRSKILLNQVPANFLALPNLCLSYKEMFLECITLTASKEILKEAFNLLEVGLIPRSCLKLLFKRQFFTMEVSDHPIYKTFVKIFSILTEKHI